MAMFTLPETYAALVRWQEITGLDTGSSEWGEVYQVLKDTELLRADQCPQRALFDPPELSLGDTAEVIALRLAIVGGAVFHRQAIELAGHEKYSLGTCTAIVAAMLVGFYDCFHEPRAGLPFEQALYRLETELPMRVKGLAPYPSVALKWQAEGMLAAGQLGRTSMAAQVLLAAFDDDEFAVRVFARTAESPEHHLALAPLCTGSWLVYDSTPLL